MALDLFTQPTIRSIARSLSAPELAACVQNVITWQDKGKIESGPLHALAARLVTETGVDEPSSLQMAESAVLREASIRFAGTQTGLRADQP